MKSSPVKVFPTRIIPMKSAIPKPKPLPLSSNFGVLKLAKMNELASLKENFKVATHVKYGPSEKPSYLSGNKSRPATQIKPKQFRTRTELYDPTLLNAKTSKLKSKSGLSSSVQFQYKNTVLPSTKKWAVARYRQ